MTGGRKRFVCHAHGKQTEGKERTRKGCALDQNQRRESAACEGKNKKKHDTVPPLSPLGKKAEAEKSKSTPRVAQQIRTPTLSAPNKTGASQKKTMEIGPPKKRNHRGKVGPPHPAGNLEMGTKRVTQQDATSILCTQGANQNPEKTKAGGGRGTSNSPLPRIQGPREVALRDAKRYRKDPWNPSENTRAVGVCHGKGSAKNSPFESSAEKGGGMVQKSGGKTSEDVQPTKWQKKVRFRPQRFRKQGAARGKERPETQEGDH